MSDILKAWGKIKSITRRAFTQKVNPDLIGADEAYIKKQMHECVFAKGGEISSRSRAVELGKTYLDLSKTGREKFMKILSREFDVNNQKINEIIQKIQSTEDEDTRIKAEMELSKALTPPRVRLLKQFNALPNGFKFLIDFRADLLPIRKDDPYFEKTGC